MYVVNHIIVLGRYSIGFVLLHRPVLMVEKFNALRWQSIIIMALYIYIFIIIILTNNNKSWDYEASSAHWLIFYCSWRKIIVIKQDPPMPLTFLSSVRSNNHINIWEKKKKKKKKLQVLPIILMIVEWQFYLSNIFFIAWPYKLV